jgi:hypothetical protein
MTEAETLTGIAVVDRTMDRAAASIAAIIDAVVPVETVKPKRLPKKTFAVFANMSRAGVVDFVRVWTVEATDEAKAMKLARDVVPAGVKIQRVEETKR